MTEPEDRSLGEQLLDLLVFAPAGLAMTAVEELPELATKGRARLETHLRNARFLGQFVVTKSQRDLGARVGQVMETVRRKNDDAEGSGPESDEDPSAAGADDLSVTGLHLDHGIDDDGAAGPDDLILDEDSDVATGTDTDVEDAGGEDDGGEDAFDHGVVSGSVDAQTPAPDAGAATPKVTTPGVVPAPVDPSAVDSAIAGYDTLSASQVVRRLESLGPDELRAVCRHEASHRNRRTILNRAHQLLEGAEPDQPVG